MSVIRKSGIPWRVIEQGSNLLVRDGGTMRGGQNGKRIRTVQVEGDRVTAGGGYSFVKLSVMVRQTRLDRTGICRQNPGPSGVGCVMNAGAHGSEVCEVLEKAEVFWKMESGLYFIMRIYNSATALPFCKRKARGGDRSHIPTERREPGGSSGGNNGSKSATQTDPALARSLCGKCFSESSGG